MSGLLNDNIVLVAGAGGLLGTEIVKNVVKQGGRAIAADISQVQMIDKFRAAGLETNNVDIVILDITNESEVKHFFSSREDINAAVNSTYPRNETYGNKFFEVSLESFNDNLALNLGSAFLFTQQCAAYFNRCEKPFSLVNISSVYGVIPPKFDVYENTSMTMPVEYAAIKSALIHLNKYVASYVNDSRFRINSVSPGGILDGQPEDFIKAYKNKTYGTGMLDVKEVVGAVTFLLSDQSKYISGQNLVVDDGFSIK